MIEDEDNIRKLICYDLRHEGYEVIEAADGNAAKELGLSQDFDLMLVDWMLPGIEGIDLVKMFRGHKKDSILIMLTAKGEEEDILNAFEAGVDDYVSKPFSPRVLQARIKANLKRKSDAGKLLSFNDLVIDQDKRQILLNGEDLNLTKKEYELLKYFIVNNNVVLSRDKILNEIWGFDYDGDTRIVDVHTHKLRTKLKTSASVINSNRGVGYILEKRDE